MKQGQKAWKFIRDIHCGDSRNLNSTALQDGINTYTYGLMFREWERYASVFSALGMTEETHSRVGLLGSDCAEAVFAFYGLNMVGAEVSLIPAYSALRQDRILRTIREEKLTDLIITDDFAPPGLVARLVVQKDRLGIRNVILLHVPFGGNCVNPVFAAAHEAAARQLRAWFSPICMETLLEVHGSHPVHYAGDESCDTAFILHTSGTTGGAGKPVVLSDKAFNAAAACFHKLEGYDLPMDHLVSGLIVDLSNAYGIIDQVHMPLSMGAAVAIVPGGALNPDFYKAVPEYGISVLFCISAMLERWMKMPDSTRFDFSSLRFVAIGGTAVSAKDKRRYYDFLHSHGAGEISLVNGYGISELGGACCLSTPDVDDESIGYPLPGVNLQLYDEETDRFYSRKDAPCEGILYLSSPSVAAPGLDDKTSLELVTIRRRPYVCTNDLARLDEDGKITYLGRANRYFLNNSGIKYESGRVETEISRQSGIGSCGVIPVYEKTRHDNLPMLCVKTLHDGSQALELVRKALLEVFGIERALAPDQIPCRVLIAEEDLPRNSNGKLDLYRINQGGLPGQVYQVKPVRLAGRIIDFRLLPIKEGPADMIQDVFTEIAADLKADLKANLKANRINNVKSSFNNVMKNNLKTEASVTEAGEDTTMNKDSNPFAAFQSMNQMAAELMKNMNQMAAEMIKSNNPMSSMNEMNSRFMNMMGMTGRKFAPGTDGNDQTGFCGMPDMQTMMNFMNMFGQNGTGSGQTGFCGMPDMQSMMNFMSMLGQNGTGSGQTGFCGMPDLQSMMNYLNMMNPCGTSNGQAGFTGLPFLQQMNSQAGFPFMPWFQQMNQMVSWMNQMNQMAWMMIQQMYMQNFQMMNSFFQNYQSGSAAASEENSEDAVGTEEKPESWKEAKDYSGDTQNE